MSATTFVGGALDRNEPLARAGTRHLQDRMGIMGEIRLIAGALVSILIIALILFEVSEAVNIGDGPFSGIEDDLQTTGVAAITLLVVALLVVAAAGIMRIMSVTGFGGR